MAPESSYHSSATLSDSDESEVVEGYVLCNEQKGEHFCIGDADHDFEEGAWGHVCRCGIGFDEDGYSTGGLVTAPQFCELIERKIVD